MIQSWILLQCSIHWSFSTLERQGECLAASKHPGPDGADGHVEAGGDFSIAEPFHMERQERLLLPRGERGEGLAQLLQTLALRGLRFGAGLVTRQELDGVVPSVGRVCRP